MPVDLIKDPVTVNNAARASVCRQALLNMAPRVELAGAVLVHTHVWPTCLVRQATDELRDQHPDIAVRPLVAVRVASVRPDRTRDLLSMDQNGRARV